MVAKSHWYSIDRLSSIADLAFKLFGGIAALLAIGYLFFRPDVDILTQTQAFLDLDVVSAEYERDGVQVPSIVMEVAEEYDARNADDLLATDNSNPTYDLIPEEDLCRDMEALIDRLFPDAGCADGDSAIGRGRFYERALLRENFRSDQPLSFRQLQRALDAYLAAEYLKARSTVTNSGNGTASQVSVVPADGFHRVGASGTFSIHAGSDRSVTFESDRGVTEHYRGVNEHRNGLDLPGDVVGEDGDAVEAQFSVNWKAGTTTYVGPWWVLGGIIAVVVVVFAASVADYVLFRRRNDAESAAGSSGGSSTTAETRPSGTA